MVVNPLLLGIVILQFIKYFWYMWYVTENFIIKQNAYKYKVSGPWDLCYKLKTILGIIYNYVHNNAYS